jgi:hypothetical protein
MMERFGRRWIFGGLAAAALAIIVFGMRRRAASDASEDAGGELHGTVGERFGEDREEDQEASLPKEELVRRAQQISRGPARERQESEPTDAASETEQEEVSGESARGESQESEQTDMASESQESERANAASETEQEARRYLKDVQFPASKDDLVSAARSNDAPQGLIEKLVDLPITEYSDLEEVVVAVDSGP